MKRYVNLLLMALYIKPEKTDEPIRAAAKVICLITLIAANTMFLGFLLVQFNEWVHLIPLAMLVLSFDGVILYSLKTTPKRKTNWDSPKRYMD